MRELNTRSGFFTDRLWQFNQGEWDQEVKLVVSTSKRQDAVYPEESPGERWRPLECALHPDGILRRCFLSVSGQPNGKKVRDGGPGGTGRNSGREKGRDRGGVNGIGGFVEPPTRRRALRTREQSKRRREGAVTQFMEWLRSPWLILILRPQSSIV